MFIHKCVKPTRYFVNRLPEALRNSQNKHIKVTTDMRKDIAWFIEFLPVFNGAASYDDELVEFSETLEIDACSMHIGGYGTTQCTRSLYQTISETIPTSA